MFNPTDLSKRETMHLIALLLAFGLLSIGESLYSALPPQAQAYLALLPDKALTPELVIGQAIQRSDSYRGVKAQLPATEVASLRGQAPLSTKINAQFDFIDDQSRAATPFQTLRMRSKKLTMGVTTLFKTGTALSFELSHGLTDLTFTQFTVDPYAETRGLIGISQSLWRDAFGASTRAAVNSAERASDASRAAFQSDREDWFLQILQVYYQAWLAQAQERASRRNLENQERLLKTIEVKLKRGTAEEPDRLQVLGSRTGAEVQLQQDRQNLGDLWRNLITTLKLPESFHQVDPSEIPMRLDAPVESALSKCGPPSNLNAAPENSSAILRMQANYESARLQTEKALSDFNPSLDLNVAFGANNVEPNSGATVDQFLRLRYPKYSASILFKLPLGFYAERAQLAEARANEVRAEAHAMLAKDSLKMDWTNGCLDLHRIRQNRDWLEKTVQNQQRREKLEEERFQLGRAGTIQVIQAGADATQAEQLLHSTETKLRLAAWKVHRLTGRVQQQLNELEASASQ